MDLFDCSVCLNNMLDRTPRSLFCLHSFCTDCLTRLIVGKVIECPTCREITELKIPDVKELKVNFMLHQFKERDQLSHKPLCQICQQTEALLFCYDCVKQLCLKCKEKHDGIKEFQTHNVSKMSERSDLCPKHKEEATHLCKKCVSVLCIKCMLLDHSEHMEEFVSLDKGEDELKKELEKNLKVAMTKLDILFTGFVEKQELVNEIKDSLKEWENYYIRKTQEVGKIIKEVEDNLETCKNIEKDYKNQFLESEDVLVSLKQRNMHLNVMDFYNSYKELQDTVNTVVENMNMKMRSLEEFSVPLMEVTQPPLYDLRSHNFQHMKETKELKVSQVILDMNQSPEIQCRSQIAFIGSDVLLPTHNQPYHVLRLSQCGKVVARYYPSVEDKVVYGVAVFENNIYIVQREVITALSHENEAKAVIYKPEIKSMSKILIKDQRTIFITDCLNPGHLYKYDTTCNTTETLIEALNQPTFMSVIHTSGGPRYIVTEYGANCVKIFDHKWRYLNSLESPEDQLLSPGATAVTDMGTVLLADSNNHRISHYALNGKLLSHTLTGESIAHPIGVAYKFPHLWVCHPRGEYVKCFEVEFK